MNNSKNYLIISAIILLLFIIKTPVFSQNTDNTGAKQYAAKFFNISNNSSKLKSAASANALTECYQSSAKVKTPLYIFNKAGGGFVIIAQSHNTYKVVGYSDKDSFSMSKSPAELKSLFSYYEDSLQFINTSLASPKEGTPVVAPLLYEHGINLNQYTHSEVGGSPSGCVATALTQIMLYYAAEQNTPVKGYGSHCYTHPTYGKICADFGNANYANNPKLLSFHVGISLDMNYSPDWPGSSPPAGINIPARMSEYFHYFVANGLRDNFYLKEELDNRRPLYVELYGKPIGHAIVIDGYDDRGYFHLNLGWGGNSNGYYLLNNFTWFKVPEGHIFNSSLARVMVVSPKNLPVNKQDSLALVAVYNALGGHDATQWDLTKSMWGWPGVVIMNGRVIRLELDLKAPPAASQSIAPEIGNLTELQVLNLGGCFNGNIPATINNLTNLKELIISNHTVYANSTLYKGNLRSNLFNNITHLTKLESLSASNCLEGTIPPSIGNLVNLKTLVIFQDTASFGKGGLTGAIPDQIGSLTHLGQFVISNQQLNGNMPKSIGNLPELVAINLSGNELTGAIPAMKNPKLEYLELNNNQLTGFAEGNWSCPQLVSLKLQDNNISGALPESMGNLTSLQQLYLENNKITALPDRTGDLLDLETLNANNNKLKVLPNSLALLPNLKNLKAKNNQLSYIPDNLGESNSLEYIDLSNNQLPSIPPKIGNCPDLREIDLSNNQIDSIPESFTHISDFTTVLLQNNKIQGKIPANLMMYNPHSGRVVRLGNNRFVFSDIPKADSLGFGLHRQNSIPLSKQLFKVQKGDTVTLDIRKLTHLSDSANEYYWLIYPDFKDLTGKTDKFKALTESPVLKFVVNDNTPKNKFYCKVFNAKSPQYLLNYNGSVSKSPVLDYLNTDTIAFKLATDEELIADKYPNKFVTSLNNIPGNTLADRTVTLVPPVKIKRGVTFWEASSDGSSWEKVTDDMARADLKANVVTVNKDALVLSPRNTAYYRCCLLETGCDTMYSNKLQVKALGKVLFDDMVNVKDSSRTVKADSIEVTLPKNFHNSDFRLTITKIAHPPAAPDSVIAGSAYDVVVSFADTFPLPLLIKLKNIDKTKVQAKDINKIKAVYFNDKERKWKLFGNMHLSLKDSSVVFTTHHLTKLSYWWDTKDVAEGYTDKYERNNICVYYKDDDIDYMKFIYARHQTSQPWHVASYPLLVQDITEYLPKVMKKYKEAGLESPDGTFNVYVKKMNDAGCVGLLGMLNGYMLIDAKISSPKRLKGVLAHEFMHYTQDYYISANPGNSFWMEAHASVEDRVVWGVNDIPVCESERTLLKGRTSKNSIFNFLSNSWDYWDKSFIASNLTGNIFYDYMAGTFLHYMQSFRTGDKLDPLALLKETTWFGSWRNYLAGFVAEHLNSDLGKEYDGFVKYIISGVNDNFSLLDKKSNPFFYFEEPQNAGVFTYPVTYNFKDKDEPIKTDIAIKVPYLAAKIILLKNIDRDSLVVVNYKREADNNKNHLVYYASYNAKKKKMEYVNISDSTEYNFLLDARNKGNIHGNFKNYGIILLINKEYDKKATDFKVSIKLTATPLLNIENIGMLNIYNGQNPIKHNFNDKKDYISVGTPNAAYWHSATGYTAYETDKSISKKMADNHTVRTITKYSLIVDQPEIMGDMTQKDSTVFEQIIEQDIISGLTKITEHKNKYQKLHTYYDYILNAKGDVVGYKLESYPYIWRTEDKTTVYWLKDITDFVRPKSEAEGFEEEFGENIKFFETNNTSETRSVVTKIDAHYKITEYNKYGNVTSTTNETYSGTDYSLPNLKLLLIIRTK